MESLSVVEIVWSEDGFQFFLVDKLLNLISLISLFVKRKKMFRDVEGKMEIIF